jgi:hypothetical protein
MLYFLFCLVAAVYFYLLWQGRNTSPPRTEPSPPLYELVLFAAEYDPFIFILPAVCGLAVFSFTRSFFLTFFVLVLIPSVMVLPRRRFYARRFRYWKAVREARAATAKARFTPGQETAQEEQPPQESKPQPDQEPEPPTQEKRDPYADLDTEALYRLAAKRFHPDLAKSGEEVQVRTEVMSLLNHARGRGDRAWILELLKKAPQSNEP